MVGPLIEEEKERDGVVWKQCAEKTSPASCFMIDGAVESMQQKNHLHRIKVIIHSITKIFFDNFPLPPQQHQDAINPLLSTITMSLAWATLLKFFHIIIFIYL